jgi:signal transduction histidine kinase
MEPRPAVPDAAPSIGVEVAPARSGAETWRVLASLRVMVAIFAATEAVSLPAASRSALVSAVLGYTAYAGWLYWAALYRNRPLLPRLSSWIDAAAILSFAWLAAAQSQLLMLLLFPVLFAAVSFSFLSGLLVSLFAAAAAAAQVTLQAPEGGPAMQPPLLQPLLILALGPLVAALARAGVRIHEQMRIADRLLGQLDPRLGVQRVAQTLLQALTPRFEADRGLLLVWPAGGEPRLFRSDADGGCTELAGELRATLVDALARLPAGIAATWRRAPRGGLLAIPCDADHDLGRRPPAASARAAMAQLAELLEASALLAAPLCRRSPHPCRLLFASARRRYRPGDASLLANVMDRLSPVVENAGLLESLAEEAMATERARIGRDLHDSAIQPYLGLKYGIEALARKAGADNPLREDIRALQEVAVGELHQLRELVSGMRSGARGADDALGPALRRQARRFTELFGIEVAVHCAADVAISRRLAAAVFPMVGEALTNVRRHTDASRADIAVREEAGRCVLEVTNAHDPERPPAAFVPRSIVERVESIGGRAVVDLQGRGTTGLIISIPKTLPV